MVSRRPYNISLIGDARVGKTTLVKAMFHEQIPPGYSPTCGCCMVKVGYDHFGTTIWFYMWDTAGEERYKSLAPIFYRGSDAAIIVYDVTMPGTFRDVGCWRDLYFSTVPGANPVVVIGNKIDLADQIAVTEEEGRSWANDNGCQFLQMSALRGTNVPDLLDMLARIIPDREGQPAGRTITQERRSRKCC
jgi:small GTP-binding protein